MLDDPFVDYLKLDFLQALIESGFSFDILRDDVSTYMLGCLVDELKVC